MKNDWTACRKCVSESFPGYIKQLDSQGRELLIECNCHKSWRELQTLVYRLKEASLPFSEFILSYSPEKDYIGDKETVKKIIKIPEILKIETDKSHLIYFTGESGVQKTISAQWIGISLERIGIKTYYIPMQRLFEDIIPSFDNKTVSQKILYETIPVLIIDDAFSTERVILFKNKNYQLAPFDALIRKRMDSTRPKHTIIISDNPVGKISFLGFGKDMEYLISSRASVLSFTDEYDKLISKFDPKKDIFGENN